ncbi:PREDICTED: YTH domain-containing family protein 2 isoform X2 [Tarenaya hassleriana]|uniref:YTH domain-containing family protein 2 isoform X2 n=1 Tax=Tarenaya hassleriana TaxID=28532 RepID=UPI0008FD3FF0|nr:PREDICTED: YTH domain-containing family protein 2 isoform X2 [Tarenaya hassleriana]
MPQYVCFGPSSNGLYSFFSESRDVDPSPPSISFVPLPLIFIPKRGKKTKRRKKILSRVFFISHKPLSAIEDTMKNLKVDPLAKITDSGTDKVSSSGDVKGSVAESDDADYESLETYQGLPCPYGGYYGFYYPGLDGSVGEAKDQGHYGYGTEVQYPVMHGENGSLIYLMPGIQPFDVSNTYLPVSPVGVDPQYTSQTLHSSAPMFAAHGYLPNPYGYGDIMSPTYLWDPSLLAGDGAFGDTYGYGLVASPPGLRQNLSSSSHNHSKSKTSFSSLNALPGHSIGNQPKTPSKNGSVLQSHIQRKGYFPLTAFPPYSQERTGMYYPTDAMWKRAGSFDWAATERVKARNKVNGSSIREFANGQAHLTNGGNHPCSLSNDGNEKRNSEASVVIRKDQYNLPGFQTMYDKALFFVIKSYSEDDVHKSIKYNVWSSTPNGNKKLENAYQEAQKKNEEEGVKYPVFLFFSVNASGQFCGVAEMIGGVDFEKSMDFWQQDKWTGYFPVKWHIIKDVPNPQLRHIALENNENKPVTNSRDTQEVRLPQGNEILNIFKNYTAKTSVLDDFDFYESREKVMQQKKQRSSVHNVAQIKTDDLVAGFRAMDISAAKAVESEGGNRDRLKEVAN